MELENILHTFLALIFVVALMGVIALIAKKLGLNNPKNSKGRRLQIVETLMIDAKRKVVILQCDDKQHLVILSQNGETVIDHEIQVPDEIKDVKPFE